MLWIAVLWSYVTDAALMLRRWRADRRARLRAEERESVGLSPDSNEYLYRRPGSETATEWFNRTEGKTK